MRLEITILLTWRLTIFQSRPLFVNVKYWRPSAILISEVSEVLLGNFERKSLNGQVDLSLSAILMICSLKDGARLIEAKLNFRHIVYPRRERPSAASECSSNKGAQSLVRSSAYIRVEAMF